MPRLKPCWRNGTTPVPPSKPQIPL